MATGGSDAIRAGMAFVEFVSQKDKFLRDVTSIRGAFLRLSSAIKTVGAAFTAVGSAIAGGIGISALAAGEAEIIQRRFDLVFRDMATGVKSQLQTLESQFGRGITGLTQSTLVFRSVLTPLITDLGLSENQVAALSTRLTRVTLDFQALTGLRTDEAMGRIVSGLTSTGEALDQFGINIRKGALENESFRIGLNKTVLQMTEAEKLFIKISLIQRQLASQNIDATKVQALFNVQLSILQEQFRELRIALGAGILPDLTRFTKALNEAVTLTAEWLKQNPMLTRTLAFTGGTLFAFGSTLFAVGVVIETVTRVLTFMVAGFHRLARIMPKIIALFTRYRRFFVGGGALGLGAGAVVAGGNIAGESPGFFDKFLSPLLFRSAPGRIMEDIFLRQSGRRKLPGFDPAKANVGIAAVEGFLNELFPAEQLNEFYKRIFSFNFRDRNRAGGPIKPIKFGRFNVPVPAPSAAAAGTSSATTAAAAFGLGPTAGLFGGTSGISRALAFGTEGDSTSDLLREGNMNTSEIARLIDEFVRAP